MGMVSTGWGLMHSVDGAAQLHPRALHHFGGTLAHLLGVLSPAVCVFHVSWFTTCCWWRMPEGSFPRKHGGGFLCFTPFSRLVDGSSVESRFGFTSQSAPWQEKLVGCFLPRGGHVMAKNCYVFEQMERFAPRTLSHTPSSGKALSCFDVSTPSLFHFLF